MGIDEKRGFCLIFSENSMIEFEEIINYITFVNHQPINNLLL